MGEYVKKKKDMIFQSGDSLQQVVNVVNEAAVALNDKKRTISDPKSFTVTMDKNGGFVMVKG